MLRKEDKDCFSALQNGSRKFLLGSALDEGACDRSLTFLMVIRGEIEILISMPEYGPS